MRKPVFEAGGGGGGGGVTTNKAADLCLCCLYMA